MRVAPEKLYTLLATARILGVGQPLVDELIAQGQLNSVRIRKRKRVPGTSIIRLLETGDPVKSGEDDGPTLRGLQAAAREFLKRSAKAGVVMLIWALLQTAVYWIK